MLSFWVSYPGVNKKKDAHHTVTHPNTLNQSGESPSALNQSENSESIIGEDFDSIIDFKSTIKLDL